MIPWNRLANAARPRTPRGRRVLAAAAMLAGAALTSVSILATSPSAEVPPRVEKSWPVSIIEVEPQPHSPTFTAYGRMESTRTANLRTDLIAEVTGVHVSEGDWVERGDLLVQLSDAEVALLVAEREADLALQEAQLRSTESERATLTRTVAQARSVHRIADDKLARHRELMERRLISQSLLDEVIAQENQAAIDLANHERRLIDLPNRIAGQRAAVAKARALVDRARLELGKAEVHAPFSGPILAVHVAPGDRTSLAGVLIEIADAQAFEVRVQVPGAYEQRFQQQLGEQDGIRAMLPDGRPLWLVRLARGVQPGQTGVDAFFRLDGAGSTAPPIGRVVDLRIQLPPEPNVVALPIGALYQNDRIYTVRENRLHSIDVERVGETRTSDGEFRILVRAPELAPGSPVITTQLPKAGPGLLVNAT